MTNIEDDGAHVHLAIVQLLDDHDLHLQQDNIRSKFAYALHFSLNLFRGPISPDHLFKRGPKNHNLSVNFGVDEMPPSPTLFSIVLANII